MSTLSLPFSALSSHSPFLFSGFVTSGTGQTTYQWVSSLHSLSWSSLRHVSPSSLLTREESPLIVLANVHVLFNPKRGDIKLGQVVTLLWKLSENFILLLGKNSTSSVQVRILLETAQKLSCENGKAPILISGDFNSTPEVLADCFQISSPRVDLFFFFFQFPLIGYFQVECSIWVHLERKGTVEDI